jgi:hypothetical protein
MHIGKPGPDADTRYTLMPFFFIFDDVEDLLIICKHIHIAFKYVWQNVNKYYSQSFVILV